MSLICYLSHPRVLPCPFTVPTSPMFPHVPLPSLSSPVPAWGSLVFPLLVLCYLSQPEVPLCPHSVPSMPARAPRAPAAASAHLPALPHMSQRGTRGETRQGTLKGTLPPPAAPVPAEEAAVPRSPASSWEKTGGPGDTYRQPQGNTDIVERHRDNSGETPMGGHRHMWGGDTGTPMGTARVHRHMA